MNTEQIVNENHSNIWRRMIQLDTNPVFRKVIVPWYDSETLCVVEIVFMVAVILFGFAGISVVREKMEYGDYIWKIFRERGLLEKRNIPKLLSTLKKLNGSLENLDLIHPGEKIIIPLTITPIKGLPKPAGKVSEIPIVPLESLKEMDMENYTVKPGDSLIKVVKGRYNIHLKNLYDEYLELVKRLNPSIKDLDIIHPGQIVRLPIYSPQIVRMPIEPIPPSPPELGHKTPKKDLAILSHQLGEIFTQMGEEWVKTGQHFIPLKSGGQITLKADSFPIINLSNGNRVIVDLYHDMPEKMAKLITSSWENYRIVHLGNDEDLEGAFDKILKKCDYHKIYPLGEPFEFGGDIPLLITADWIIKPTADPLDEKNKILTITITDEQTPQTPQDIKDFLETLGITTIDYPAAGGPIDEPAERLEILRSGNDISDLIEMLLNLAGQRFSSNMEIPIYQGEKTGFHLILKADFFLNINGRDCIIDLAGLGHDALSLLREHRFLVLRLSGEKDPSFIVSRTLRFLGVKFDSEPHIFMAIGREDSRNIRITISGIIFQDQSGQNIFATRLRLPDEITSFLSRRGYRVLSLN